MKILDNKISLRAALNGIMADASSIRIAIVAFVGADAASLLPNPKGCTVVCWPHPTGTNPRGVRALLASGATVLFADRLHSKLFWSEAGSIIGSANLSRNGFADDGLIELAVQLPRGAVDGPQLLRSLNTRAVTTEELHELDRTFAAVSLACSQTGTEPIDSSSLQTFATWARAPHRQSVQLMGWYENTKAPTHTSLESISTEYGVSKAKNWTQVTRNIYQGKTWVLQYRYDDHDDMKGGLRWFFIDHITRDAFHGDKENGEDEAIQLYALKAYGPPPFELDKRTAKVLKSCFNAAEWPDACTEKMELADELIRRALEKLET